MRYHLFLPPQACKLAIRETIEADIRKEREMRDNPDIEAVSPVSGKNLSHTMVEK